MYSKISQPQKNYIIPEIIVNGNILQTQNFSPQQWDKIVQPVILFSKQQTWNRLQFDNYIHRLLHVQDSSHYVNNLSQLQFNEWYRRYLPGIIHSSISSLTINFNEYDLNDGKPVKLRLLQSVTIQ